MNNLTETLEYVAARLNISVGEIRAEKDGDKYWLYNAKDGAKIGTLENENSGWDFYNLNNQLVLENIAANIV